MRLSDFEQKVLKGLHDCGVEVEPSFRKESAPAAAVTATTSDSSSASSRCVSQECSPAVPPIGAAVSGGADSVALLYALSEITRGAGIPLKVITVNHFIRPDEETCGDAAFVQECCRLLLSKGYDVEYELVPLERGAVEKAARERGGGVEDAARFLRYQAFDSFIKKHSLSCLCLAHNKNDQLETLLMRFLQGSWTDSASGIMKRRGFYVRPLLDIDRSEIEAYLHGRESSWRTDSTNSDPAYLRNRIRHKLIPLLDAEFSGWRSGVLSGAEKSFSDSEVISRAVEAVPVDTSRLSCGEVSVLQSDFDSLPDAVKIRVLLKMCNLLCEQNRIPYQFFKDVILSFSHKRFANLEIFQKKDRVFVKKWHKIHTDLVFFDIIREKGTYEFPFGTLVAADSVSINGVPVEMKCEFPFCIRNFCPGDEVLGADGKMKKVADIFAGWKIPAEDRALVPVVQSLNSDGTVTALLAAFMGYKDWIVK